MCVVHGVKFDFSQPLITKIGRLVMAALVLRGPYIHALDESDSDGGVEIIESEPYPDPIQSPRASCMLPEELISITSPSQLDSTRLPRSEDITGQYLAALLPAVPPELSTPQRFEESRGGKH